MIHELWTLAESSPDNPRIPIANATLRSLFVRRGVTDDESYRRFVAHRSAAVHHYPLCMPSINSNRFRSRNPPQPIPFLW